MQYNNFIWNIKYKNIELLLCISETNIILQVNYISMKNFKNGKNFKKGSGHLPTLTAKNYTQPSLRLWVPRWLSGWRISLPCRRHRRCGFDPWTGKIPWKRKWQFTPVFLPEKCHGHRSLSGYRTSLQVMTPWGRQTKLTSDFLIYSFIYTPLIFKMNWDRIKKCRINKTIINEKS